MKLSRYTLLSPDRFRDEDGVPHRCGYVSRTSALFHLRAADADLLEQGRIGELDPAMVRELRQIEAVVPDDEDELAETVGRFRANSSGPLQRRFVILPTSYCNMGCAYCGQEHVKGTVSHPRVQRKIDRILRAVADPAATSLHISWFGGEPLLGLRVIREISEAVVPAVAQAGKPYSSDVVTNGSLLNHRVLRQLYDDCQVRWIEVTIDGPRDVHNARRRMKNGAATFDHIVDLLADVVSGKLYRGLAFGVRTNVDAENEDRVPELMTELAARGLASKRIVLKPAPVHSWGNDVSRRELKRWEYSRREMGWAALADRLGMTFPAGLPSRPRSNTCIATTRNGEVIDSTGRLYSCTEHPLVPRDMVTGRLSSLDMLPPGELRPVAELDSWYDEVGAGSWQCSSCPFLPVCGGGCPKLWKEGELPCPSFKFTWVERLGRYARQQGLVPCA